MTYGTNTLNEKVGTIKIIKSKTQLVREYPGTDKSNYVNLGRKPTRIICTLVAKSDTERVLIEQIMHGEGNENLVMHSFYYKTVRPGAVCDISPATPDFGAWFINVEFIAQDPIPYSVSTDGALY